MFSAFDSPGDHVFRLIHNSEVHPSQVFAHDPDRYELYAGEKDYGGSEKGETLDTDPSKERNQYEYEHEN
jgi:hypothetical protein